MCPGPASYENYGQTTVHTTTNSFPYLGGSVTSSALVSEVSTVFLSLCFASGASKVGLFPERLSRIVIVSTVGYVNVFAIPSPERSKRLPPSVLGRGYRYPGPLVFTDY